MNTVTHALAPVILTHLAFGRRRWCGKAALVAICVAGALPDILSPHLSLDARMSSGSHGLPAWGVFTLLVVACSVIWRNHLPIPLAASLSAAYLLHLCCDAISGGINWAAPLGQAMWGDYWVDPHLWVPLDVVLLLLAYYLFRLRKLIQHSPRN